MSTDNFSAKYYDVAWSQLAQTTSAQEEARINGTLDLIPADCSSILDVGCGDGRITNRLISRYGKVCGLDISKEALKHVKSDKVLGNLDSLQFRDRAFDLLLCCEVLEHLPFGIYEKALRELERVSKKYIIITVPNDQHLESSITKCPYCGCFFNTSRHIRTFNIKTLENIFKEFKPVTLEWCVPTARYPGFLYSLRDAVRNPSKKPYPPTAVCPQCGYSKIPAQQSAGPAGNHESTAMKILQQIVKVIPKKKTGVWLIGLYQRR